MSSLDLLDELPFATAAVIVGPDSALDVHGDVEAVRPWRSVSKALVGLACAHAAEQGLLDLDAEALPGGVTARHLLSHAGGYWYEEPKVWNGPAVKRQYSNFGVHMAGGLLVMALEREDGRVGVRSESELRAAAERTQALDAALQRLVLQPAGMVGTRFEGLPANGAVGPIADLARLAMELLQPRGLSAAAVRAASTVQFPQLHGLLPGYGMHKPNPFGLGLEVRGQKSPTGRAASQDGPQAGASASPTRARHWSGRGNSPRTVGHFGMSGTMLWADPEARLGLALGSEADFGDHHRRILPLLADAALAENGPEG